MGRIPGRRGSKSTGSAMEDAQCVGRNTRGLPCMEYRKQRKMDLGDLFIFLYNSPEILKTKIHLLCLRF